MTDIEKRTPIAATAKKEQGKKKNYYKNKTNQENLDAAMVMLENIKRNYYGEVNRNTKNRMNELLVLLKDKEQKFSLSVRAANALSILDGMTQDKMMKSHIRTMLWQVVSNLEGIRE
jgi:uncharacterized protein (UPF0147 family)